MSQQALGRVVLVVGIVVTGGSLLADAIGIGGGPGIGMKQITGSLIGLVTIVVGVLMMRRADQRRQDSGPS